MLKISSKRNCSLSESVLDNDPRKSRTISLAVFFSRNASEFRVHHRRHIPSQKLLKANKKGNDNVSKSISTALRTFVTHFRARISHVYVYGSHHTAKVHDETKQVLTYPKIRNQERSAHGKWCMNRMNSRPH